MPGICTSSNTSSTSSSSNARSAASPELTVCTCQSPSPSNASMATRFASRSSTTSSVRLRGLALSCVCVIANLRAIRCQTADNNRPTGNSRTRCHIVRSTHHHRHVQHARLAYSSSASAAPLSRPSHCCNSAASAVASTGLSRTSSAPDAMQRSRSTPPVVVTSATMGA